MFDTVSHYLNILLVLNLSLVILACWLLIKLPMATGAKYFLIPAVLLSTYLLIHEGEELFGRPYDAQPVGEFEFLDYRVVKTEQGKRIELWVIQDKKSRLHIIDHSAKREEELAKAKNGKRNGVRQRGEFERQLGKKGTADSNLENQRPLIMHDITINNSLPPKE